MNPSIASIENLIASDPGSRNIFGLVAVDQLRLAAQSLRFAKRVGIVSGFYVPSQNAGETDGPPGAKIVGQALQAIGIDVDYITDEWNEPVFRALQLDAKVAGREYLERTKPSHLLSIERVGRASDGRYRNMRGEDISACTAPLDEMFLLAKSLGITTVGIGDGGNEIGMGKVFGEACEAIKHGKNVSSTVATDFCVVSGVSNWGAIGLAGALSVLEGRDLLPSAAQIAHDLETIVSAGVAVDGVTQQRAPTVDGQSIADSVRMLEGIRSQITPSPFQKKGELEVGILGFGIVGRAAQRLLDRHGHRVRVSDASGVAVDPGTLLCGLETGKHTVEFLDSCDLVVASPGVRANATIRDLLHHRGIPIVSELELGYQFCSRPIIAVTGTRGKRSTLELMQSVFESGGRHLTIGGNRGDPLSAILTRDDPGRQKGEPIALAVSSFQLETVVDFRPHIAVMLNIDEEHLDRHHSMAEYVRIKSRIFMTQLPQDVLILNYDDERLRPLSRKHSGRVLFVSSRQPVDRGAWVRERKVYINTGEGTHCLGHADTEYPENLLSSVVVAQLCGVGVDTMSRFISGLSAEGVV